MVWLMDARAIGSFSRVMQATDSRKFSRRGGSSFCHCFIRLKFLEFMLLLLSYGSIGPFLPFLTFFP